MSLSFRGSSSDNTLHCDYTKLRIQSGQFTSTVKDSIASTANTQAISRVDSDVTPSTLITVAGSDKHFKLSGQFTSTVKASLNVNTTFGETEPRANQGDGQGNSTLTGLTLDKLFHISGQFSSTVKDSLNVGVVYSAGQPEECNIDGVGNTSWCAATPDDLFLTSGHFTTTLKLSISVSAINSIPCGVSWAGYDTLWSGNSPHKMYRNSGQFTTTIHDSQVQGANGGVRGIVTQNYAALMADVNKTKTLTADAAVQDINVDKDFAVNARLMNRYTKDFTADGSLQATLEKDFTVDARVMGRGSRSFTCDSDLIILPGDPIGNRPGDYDPDLGSPDYHITLIVIGHKVIYFGEE